LLYSKLRDELFGAVGTWDLHQCTDARCGLASLQPPPSSAEIMAAYENYHTHQHDLIDSDSVIAQLWYALRKHYHGRKFGYRLTTDTVTPAGPTPRLINLVGNVLSFLIPILPGHRADLDASVFYLPAPLDAAQAALLEVGCGSGKILQYLASLGWQVTGTDFDESAVTHAQQRGINVHLGPLANQDFGGQRFDAIVLKHVIEHVPDPAAELRLCRELLKPHGQLVMLTPNLAGRGHNRWQRQWRGLEPPRHLQLYGPIALQRLLKGAGFGSAEISTTGRARSASIASLNATRASQGKGAMTTPIAQLWGELDEWLEAFAIFRNPLAGNELLAIARPAANPEPSGAKIDH